MTIRVRNTGFKLVQQCVLYSVQTVSLVIPCMEDLAHADCVLIFCSCAAMMININHFVFL